MELFLIRHGIAVEATEFDGEDAERPLTKAGIVKTTKIAKQLRKLGIGADRVVTSPLVRALQTAVILVETGKLANSIEVHPELSPGGDLMNFLSQLSQWQKDDGNEKEEVKRIIAVGHEPDITEWTEKLVYGNVYHHLVIKKAGIVGIQIPTIEDAIGKSQLFLLMPPRYLDI
jgi:phosphohistidine phosphatase